LIKLTDQLDIVRRILLGGEATSDTAYKKEIVKEIIYKASDLLAIGTKLIPIKPLSALDVKFTYPGAAAAKYPVPEGRTADIKDIDWPELGYSLLKAQSRFRITKEAKIRGQGDNQRVFSMRRCVEALAAEQDAEIIDKIIAAIGNTVTIAAGNEWNTDKGDPEKDILAARQLIMDKSNVTAPEIKNLGLMVGTNVSTQLLRLQLIGNVQQSMETYLKTALGITLFESRDTDFADAAYLLVMGRKTGEHGVYTGPASELVENYPVHGVGQEWLISKFFATKILPDVAAETTTKRIVKIDNTYA